MSKGEPLEVYNVDSLRNDQKRNEISVSGRFGLSVSPHRKLRFELTVPITYLMLMKNDQIRNTISNNGYFLFAPNLRTYYALNPRTKLICRVNYQNNVGGLYEDLHGYILKDYRNLYSETGNTFTNKNSFLKYELTLDYRNPFSLLFIALNLQGINFWYNTLYDTTYHGIFARAKSIEYAHLSKNYKANLMVDKDLEQIHTTVKFNIGWSTNSTVSLINEQITPLMNSYYYTRLTVINQPTSVIVLKYSGSYLNSRIKSGEKRLTPISNLQQQLSASFQVIKNLTISVNGNHYYNSAIKINNKKSFWFADIEAKYKRPKAEYTLSWNNIFNNNEFNTYLYNNKGSTYSRQQIRPQELLLRVRFNF